MAAQLEDAAWQSQPETVAERLDALEEEFGRVLAGLARLDETESAPIPEWPPE